MKTNQTQSLYISVNYTIRKALGTEAVWLHSGFSLSNMFLCTFSPPKMKIHDRIKLEKVSFVSSFIMCTACVCRTCYVQVKHVNVETLLVRQGDTSWSLICRRKCLPGFALEVGAMVYSGGRYQDSRQRKRTSQAERRREEQISLNLQRYSSRAGQSKAAVLDLPVSSKLILRSFSTKGVNIRSSKKTKTKLDSRSIYIAILIICILCEGFLFFFFSF